jgi:Cu/Ag efflux protein CusF
MLLLLSLSFAACGASRPADSVSSATPSESAPSTIGTIKEVRKGGAVLLVAHEDIPGVMPAMTMPFQVAEKARRADLKAGDRIKFWLEEREGVYVIIKIDRA